MAASPVRNRQELRRRIVLAFAVLGSCLSVAVVVAGAQTSRADSTCDGKLPSRSPTYITAWFHAGGAVTAEAKTLRRQVQDFNASQRQVRVKLITLPVGDYSRQVALAAARGDLPDVLDFDGPNLYNYAWSGRLKPSC